YQLLSGFNIPKRILEVAVAEPVRTLACRATAFRLEQPMSQT
ncbi:hypothetical protein AVDCRST_MAG94-3670, partial [uncultured Leptolyngbya sp.]